MIKVLDGRATPHELDDFSLWMASAETHRQEFQQVRQWWMDARGPWPTAISQKPLDQIHQRMNTRLRNRKLKLTAIRLAAMTMLATLLWWAAAHMHDRGSPRKQLIFNATTLTEVATTLEQNFHTHIVFEQEALANCRFTGSFSKASTLQDIMQAIAKGLAMSVEKTDMEYRWRGEGC